MSVLAHRGRYVLSRGFLLAGTSLAALWMSMESIEARSLNGGNAGGAVSAPNIAADAASQAAQQAAAAARQTQDSLARAARAVQDIQAVQAAARAAAAAAQVSATAPVVVPNGLAAGGLLPNTPRWGGANTPQNWVGANEPTQSVDGNGQTQVNIRQQAQQAILNWQSFNVGARTTLTFDQQGNANWVALNRVDRNAGPSQILGNIKADGQVYVINQSGIIFGGNSQVNVGSLIAAAADVTPDQFAKTGIFSELNGSVYTPNFKATGGKVVVEAGAVIGTRAPSSVTAGGGYVLMIGSEVSNSGAIATPKGQTILAAGDDFVLRRGFSTDANSVSTTRGIEISPQFKDQSSAGRVSNDGLIFAQQGDITLAGRNLLQNGALLATTSVNTRGTIHLLNRASDNEGAITLGAAALTAILPELDSTETALDSQRDGLIAASNAANAARAAVVPGVFDNLSMLADRQDQSRIEIVSGATVTFKGGSYTAAQGGQIAVSAKSRIVTETGATLDVSGIRNVALAMAANNMQVNIQGNELRDSPQNRDGSVLKNENVWIDIRTLTLVPAGTGGYDSDRYYTGGGLLEVGGYLANTAHGIGEWAAVGGTITLASDVVIAQKGAVFDLSGGSLDFSGGYIRSTNLISRDGRRYSIDNAPGDLEFANFAGSFRRSHNIQGQEDKRLTEIWTSIFDRGRNSIRWEDGYTVGRDAGRLNLATPTAVFEADIIADVVQGGRQNGKRPSGVTDGYKATQTIVAQAATLASGNYNYYGRVGVHDTDVKIGDIADITAGRDLAALPQDRKNTLWLDAGRLNGMKLGGLDLATAGKVTINSALTLADGGVLNVIASIVDIAADMTAHGGRIAVTNVFQTATPNQVARGLMIDGKSNVTLREGATLDVGGLWVNARINLADSNKAAFIDGGSVSLVSTGDVSAAKGSLIDVSSGAFAGTNGKIKGGKGGDLTLAADYYISGGDAATTLQLGALTLNADIRAYGMTGGGTLTITSGPGVVIGGAILRNNGELGAGEAAPMELIADKAFTIRTGEILPIDYQFTKTIALPGETVGGTPQFTPQNPGILAGAWTLPAALVGQRYTVSYVDGTTGASRSQTVRTVVDGTVVGVITLPVNSRITRIADVGFPSSFVIPANVFPTGVPISPTTLSVSAGAPAPLDITFAAGTIIPVGSVSARPISVKPLLNLDASLFQTGFGSYDITGSQALAVTEQALIKVETPVYRPLTTALSSPTGSASGAAFEVWTPPAYQESPASGVFDQRSGGDLTLQSDGSIRIGTGAVVSVDPGRNIDLIGNIRGGSKQITVDGTLNAFGGAISITSLQGPAPDSTAHHRSIWIGDHAVLDVAGRAVITTDRLGRRYGVVQAGGTIAIGGTLDWEVSGQSISPDLFAVIRPGAILDASGTSAVIDVPASGGWTRGASMPLMVASDGGSVVIKSNAGLYLDGTLRASAGGTGAAGGTLALALEAPLYDVRTVTNGVLQAREFVIAQFQGAGRLAATLQPGASDAALKFGTARIGADKIAAGGFGNLSLLSTGIISFDGDVALQMGQSLRLYGASYALSQAAATNAQINLAAPHVLLAGATQHSNSPDAHRIPVSRSTGALLTGANAAFRIDADLIDIRDLVGFGLNGTIPQVVGTIAIQRNGFGTVDLVSRGDVRLLQNNGPTADDTTFPKAEPADGSARTLFAATGDLNITAAQIYPATGVDARIKAARTLTVQGTGSAPDLPWSAFGRLELEAETIIQGGILRAPGGAITVGVNARQVSLLPGSVTSVSLGGLLLPYGGTSDGLSWNYDGTAVVMQNIAASGNTVGEINLQSGVLFGGASIDIRSGAVIDLRGGGELSGAGFVSGRGGSVDVLRYALAAANPGFGYSNLGSSVYAIVPNYRSGFAPVSPEAGAGNPVVGQQITIPAGVPGLPAGTYTLLPSDYALLPGAFRVELGGTGNPMPAAARVTGNGSYLAQVYLGQSATGIRASLPNDVIISPADKVRAHSFYNETSYSEYAVTRSTQLGLVRPLLPIDGRPFALSFSQNAAQAAQPLRFDGEALFAGAGDGYAGYAMVAAMTAGSKIEVLGASSVRTPGYISITDGMLSAIDAPRLIIGGRLSMDAPLLNGFPTQVISVSGPSNPTVVIRSGAVLRAGEVMLPSSQGSSIVVEAGAVISTLGRGPTSFDVSGGYVFDGGMLAVSNGMIQFLPPTVGRTGTIDIGGCLVSSVCSGETQLYSEGSIAIVSAQDIKFGANVRYGTRNLQLGSASINIGSSASLDDARSAGVLPTGISFNQDIFDRLIAGNASAGIPKLENLTLTARNAVNFFGSVDVNTIDPVTGQSSLTDLVLNAPAIYGYGTTADVASLRTGKLVWSGIVDPSLSISTSNKPVPPGAVIPGGAGTGLGSLNLAATIIELGYANGLRIDNQVTADRLVLGFGTVNLTASERIGGNAKGTLSVYQSGPSPDANYNAKTYAGTGGTLNLITPLLSGAAGSTLSVKAGGALNVSAPTGNLAASSSDALGATINLEGQTVSLDTAVALPSGRLTVTAKGDVVLTDRARIDMSGRKVQIFDVASYSWGGDVAIESADGSVVQAAGSMIDISAEQNAAGSLSVTALEGQASLAGTIRGTATGVTHVGGGVMLPNLSGRISVRGQTIADFVGLNNRLGAGGVFGARSFQIKQGNLVVGDELKANSIVLSVDGGSLTVVGRIDASGERVGTIRLAARDGLTLASGAVLDAHGTVLRVDSDGDVIDAPNRAVIELTTSAGTLTMQSGSVIDLRSADGVARGSLTLNAPRAGADDIAIAAAGPLDIRGARSIALNAFRSYAPTDSILNQAYMDAIHADSTAFIDAALGNTALRGRIAGLTAYVDAFHLRPGVEITSTDKLTVFGDIDLSGYRYRSLNPHSQLTGVYGSGEPGALTIRAAGDLDIQGSVNDGFAPPPGTPDDKGWSSAIVSFPGGVVTTPYNLPAGAIVPKGATFATGAALDFDARFERAILAEAGKPTTIDFQLPQDYLVEAGQPMPVSGWAGDWFVLDRDWVVPEGTYANAVINDEIVFAGAGTPLSAGTQMAGIEWGIGGSLPINYAIPQGTYIWSGTVLAKNIYGAGPEINANIAMPSQVALNRSYTLASNMIVSGTVVTPSRTYVSGETITMGTVLPVGTTLGVGTSLPFAVEIQQVLWPKGTPLSFTSPTMTLAADAKLTANGILPAGTTNVSQLYLREGRVWAVAPMLAPGSLSWDLRLGAGADLQSANQQALQSPTRLSGAGNITLSDMHYTAGTTRPVLSVIRTGTGDLDIFAGGNMRQDSLFGIYTAGTQSRAVLAADGSNPFNRPRLAGSDGIVIGAIGDADYESVVTGDNHQAWYPELGGNLSIAVNGDLSGAIQGVSPNTQGKGDVGSSYVGNWLWSQGGDGVNSAWWINFGTYVRGGVSSRPLALVPGFSGIGTLGGGNLRIDVGGDAGVLASRGTPDNPQSQGLNLAIGSTGRVLDNGTVVKTGGGDLSVNIAGALNPLDPRLNASIISNSNNAYITMLNDLSGVVTNIRGAANVMAGAVGRIDLIYGSTTAIDPRAPQPFVANDALSSGGWTVMQGDSVVTLAARGDLVIGGFGDPGRHGGALNAPGTTNGNSFPLYTSEAVANAMSAGGNLVPFKLSTSGYQRAGLSNSLVASIAPFGSAEAGSLDMLAPPVLRLGALSGNAYFDTLFTNLSVSATGVRGGILLLPSPTGGFSLTVRQSIYGGQGNIDISGADVEAAYGSFARPLIGSNYLLRSDTVLGNLHAGDRDPVRIYAAEGDILNLRSGRRYETVDSNNLSTVQTLAAKPVWMRAGRDLVNISGVVLNNDIDSVSMLWAGRDVLYPNMQVAGPGLLDVGAGRDIYLADQGQLVSRGAIVVGDTRPGASILMQAGMGAVAPDYATLAARYLDPANLAVTGTPLADQPGKVAKTYEKELADWLAQRFGFTGTAEQARAYFGTLDADQRGIFLRRVYFAELTAAGREYNDPESSRYQNYSRGREAIATLFPEKGANGNTILRSGDITLVSTESYSVANPPVRTTRDGSVRTLFGGDIQMLAPGGRVIVGVEGVVPGANAGLLTQGGGDIQIYSQGSLLLGLSRIMTTFGDDIIAWSNQGDINAGRGAKTTIGYTPAKRVQDDYGTVTLSPNAPTSGAGISARSAIPGIPSGDIDLIAPQGTIDIGEAGVSGRNINLVALQIVNAANITAQGNVSGVPTVQAPSISAALTTSNATAATQQTAIPGQGSGNERPSVIIVEVLGYGGGGANSQDDEEQILKRDNRQTYNANSALQVVGVGSLSERQKQALTTDEQVGLEEEQ